MSAQWSQDPEGEKVHSMNSREIWRRVPWSSPSQASSQYFHRVWEERTYIGPWVRWRAVVQRYWSEHASRMAPVPPKVPYRDWSGWDRLEQERYRAGATWSLLERMLCVHGYRYPGRSSTREDSRGGLRSWDRRKWSSQEESVRHHSRVRISRRRAMSREGWSLLIQQRRWIQRWPPFPLILHHILVEWDSPPVRY